jgi:spoIIIJ-associated protein
MAFGRDARGDRHYVVDAMGFRRKKDDDLREQAKAIMVKAKATGVPQEIGPLNPYARRIVHLTVAEDPSLSSDSIGDSFLKSIVISKNI